MATKIKIQADGAKLSKAMKPHAKDLDRAPDVIADRLNALYDSKMAEHREAGR